MNHVRIKARAAGRRLRGWGTLCGANMTDNDMTLADARGDMRQGWSWLTCEKCRALIEGDANARACAAKWIAQEKSG